MVGRVSSFRGPWGRVCSRPLSGTLVASHLGRPLACRSLPLLSAFPLAEFRLPVCARISPFPCTHLLASMSAEAYLQIQSILSDGGLGPQHRLLRGTLSARLSAEAETTRGARWVPAAGPGWAWVPLG